MIYSIQYHNHTGKQRSDDLDEILGIAKTMLEESDIGVSIRKIKPRVVIYGQTTNR